jgi:hypothetical protein
MEVSLLAIEIACELERKNCSMASDLLDILCQTLNRFSNVIRPPAVGSFMEFL